MKWWPVSAVSSTFVRWSTMIAAGFATMALALFAFIYWQTTVYEQARIDGVLLRETQLLTSRPASQVGQQLASWLEADVHEVLYGGVFTADGDHEIGNLLAIPRDLDADGVPHRAVFGPIGRDRDGDDPEVVRGVATRMADGRLLVIGFDMDELVEVNAIIVRALSLSLVPMTLLSVGGGMLLTLRAHRRIGDVHLAINRVMDGAFHERLPVHGSSDDLGKVSGAVNRMLDRIEYLVGELRGVGDGIAHDLRTPLSRLRTRLERSRDEALTRSDFQVAIDRAIASVDATLGIVSAVLRIGEIEHGRRRAAFSPVDLAGVLADVAELYQPIAEERAIQLNVQASISLVVSGDRDLLLEAIGNLVDNAVKFAPEASAVTLSLELCGKQALLGVVDRGQGIPSEERERVLQRFYRIEKSRTVEGSGLGLSLVAAVVALHGFEMLIRDAAPGCAVEITCPELLNRDILVPAATIEAEFSHPAPHSAI